MRRVYAKTFSLFASLKLTLGILIGVSIALFIGMFWDQTQTYNPSQHGKIFLFLELGNVFHSWWFGILVLLLALNLIACSIARLPKIWIDARNPSKKALKPSQECYLEVSQIKTPIFNPGEESWQEDQTRYIFFQKHTYARCGVYIVHTALLFIMFGSIIATQAGIDGTMLIPEGSFDYLVQAKGPNNRPYTHALNFAVACTDFRLKTYTDGSPMEYESDLVIFDKSDLNKPIISKTIRVNDPLEYQGYTFYQASYQALEGEKYVQLKMGPHGEKLQYYQVKLGESIGSIKPLEIYEDYAGLGSALKVQHNKTEFIVFRKYPEFDALVRRGDQDIIFQGFDQPYATGLSVGKVPCVSFVFAGFIIILIGLYMAFCMNQRRYYAQITPLPNGHFKLYLAGISHRYPQAFQQEFHQIVHQYQSL